MTCWYARGRARDRAVVSPPHSRRRDFRNGRRNRQWAPHRRPRRSRPGCTWSAPHPRRDPRDEVRERGRIVAHVLRKGVGRGNLHAHAIPRYQTVPRIAHEGKPEIRRPYLGGHRGRDVAREEMSTAGEAVGFNRRVILAHCRFDRISGGLLDMDEDGSCLVRDEHEKTSMRSLGLSGIRGRNGVDGSSGNRGRLAATLAGEPRHILAALLRRNPRLAAQRPVIRIAISSQVGREQWAVVVNVFRAEPVAPASGAAGADHAVQRGGDFGIHRLRRQREKLRHRLELSRDQLFVGVVEASGERLLKRNDVVQPACNAHVRIRRAAVQALEQRDDAQERHRARVLFLRAEQFQILVELRQVGVQWIGSIDTIERLADQQIARIAQQQHDLSNWR